MSEKWGLLHTPIKTNRVSYIPFFEKKKYIAALKRGPFGTHICTMPYTVTLSPPLSPPPPQPHTHTLLPPPPSPLPPPPPERFH